MNGARALIQTLVDGGVKVCFANPGTSEMHFVAALDEVAEMRGVLTLFEGVATGAADGYARMTGHPAAVLLHLGPGMANGLANLHNARKAKTPIVAVVGDHATYHKRFDAPLESDIETMARGVSGWYRATRRSRDLAGDAADAIAAASGPPGQVATLVLPADVSWSDGAAVAAPRVPSPPAAVPDAVIAGVAAALRSGEPALLFLGGRALRERGTVAAGKIAAATGAAMLSESFTVRHERGAGLPTVERLPYFAEQAQAKLAAYRHVILIDAPEPVAFFAYPGKPSELVAPTSTIHRLAGPADDVYAALDALVARLGATAAPAIAAAARPALPTGPLTTDAVARALGALMPEGAIISDEAHTSGGSMAPHTAGAPRHDWLMLSGGSIGDALPVAVGAAVACPERKVICLSADGSTMYTPQALWTIAREQLDVTTIIFNNGAYAILRLELMRTGAAAAGPGPKTRAMFSLSPPAIDFVALATSMGVSASRATTAEEFVDQLRRALTTRGPHLIDAVVPSLI